MTSAETDYTSAQVALIEDGITRGETMILIGYSEDMPIYHFVNGGW